MTRIEPDNLGEQLSAYLDGELTDAERAAVEQLLERDPSARAELERLQEAASWVRDLPRRPAPANLTVDVMRRIEAQKASGERTAESGRIIRWFVGFRPFALAAAIIVVAVGIGLWGVSQGERSGRQRRLAAVDRDVTESAEWPEAKSRGKGPPLEPKSADLKEEVLAGATEKGGLRKGGPGGRGAPSVSRPAALERPAADERLRFDEPLDHERDAYFQAADKDGVAAPEALGAVSAVRALEPAEGADDAPGWRTAPAPAGSEIDRAVGRAGLRVEVAFRERGDFELCGLRVGRLVVGSGQAVSMSEQVEDGAAVQRHLLKVPKYQLRELFTVLEAGDPRGRDVSVSVADLVHAQGWDQAHQLLAMVVPAPPAIEAQERRSRGPLAEMLQSMGVPLPDAGLEAAPTDARPIAGVTPRTGRERSAAVRQEVVDRSGGERSGGEAEGLGLLRPKKTDDAVEAPVTVELRLIGPVSPPPGEPGRLAPD